jgi:hypothetical protein
MVGYGSNFIYGSISGDVATSTDGQSWTARVSGTTSSITGFAYGNSINVFGINGDSTKFTSTDSITWYPQPGKSSILALTTGGTVFVGAGGVGVLETSNTNYSYNIVTQFQIPTDAAVNGQLTTEYTGNYRRGLYIRAL